jgi:ribosomal protein S14
MDIQALDYAEVMASWREFAAHSHHCEACGAVERRIRRTAPDRDTFRPLYAQACEDGQELLWTWDMAMIAAAEAGYHQQRPSPAPPFMSESGLTREWEDRYQDHVAQHRTCPGWYSCPIWQDQRLPERPMASPPIMLEPFGGYKGDPDQRPRARGRCEDCGKPSGSFRYCKDCYPLHGSNR